MQRILQELNFILVETQVYFLSSSEGSWDRNTESS